MKRGEAEVTEMGESGSVPEVVLYNWGDLPILLPEGEIMVGAKQNRVINITILAAARAKTTVPVSCVEQGRWHYRSGKFEPKFFASPTLRKKKTQSVLYSRRRTGRSHSDQGEVWNEVRAFQADLGTSSPTDSLTDGFESSHERLNAYRNKINLSEESAGLIVMKGEAVLGIDLFDCHSTFQQLKARILDGYYMDALRDERKRPPVLPEKAKHFLEELSSCASAQPHSLGLGVELRLENDRFTGCALWYQDKLRHLSAFGCESD